MTHIYLFLLRSVGREACIHQHPLLSDRLSTAVVLEQQIQCSVSQRLLALAQTKGNANCDLG